MKNFNSFKNETLCIICAKSNSEGVKNKNIKKINGHPLVLYAINKAKKNNFKYICISTENNKIVKIAKKKGINVFFKRSKKLCKKSTPKLSVWKDAIKKSEIFFEKKFKYIVDIEVTNPLINSDDLNNFTKSYFNKKKKYDGQFCITPAKKNPYFNIMEYINGKYSLSKKIRNIKITARQNAPKVFEHVAGLYYFKRNYLLQCKSLFQGKIFGFNVSLFKSFDIDSQLDFKLVELLLKNKKNI